MGEFSLLGGPQPWMEGQTVTWAQEALSDVIADYRSWREQSRGRAGVRVSPTSHGLSVC